MEEWSCKPAQWKHQNARHKGIIQHIKKRPNRCVKSLNTLAGIHIGKYPSLEPQLIHTKLNEIRTKNWRRCECPLLPTRLKTPEIWTHILAQNPDHGTHGMNTTNKNNSPTDNQGPRRREQGKQQENIKNREKQERSKNKYAK